MIALLLALAVQQAPAGPLVTARVDRNDLAVGELLTLTLRVEAQGNEPVEIGEPLLSGFERRGFREQSQVSIQGGVTTRVTTRQIQLLATVAGSGFVGSIRVRQGGRTAETEQIATQIAQRASVSSASLSPRARALVSDMPPPDGIEGVGLGTLAAPGSVTVGAQVDVIVAAWFPRETRLQLRIPPTLTGPAYQGAWVYPQVGPSGIAASRLVNGRWYDLFVLHDVVFPLAPGRMDIGRARVSYALPVTFSFLTRELRHEVQSEPLSVTVRAQPAAGRPVAASGMAASALRLSVDGTPRAIGLGEASNITVTLAGRGNVALWPEPEISWPDDARIYPGDVEQAVRLENGQIVGSKQFRYLLVPDSAGVHTIRNVRAAYFDMDARRYATLRAAPVEIVVGETSTAPAAQLAVLPLLDRGPGIGARPVPIRWLLVALALGPAAALLVRLMPRLRKLARRRAPPAPESLASAHRRFRVVLERLVPAAALREGDQLDAALRAAGIDQAVAAHATRVRDRLRHAVYGPGGASDPDELTAETNEVVRALIGGSGGNGGGGGIALLVLLLFAGTAQGQTAERLYETGAFRPAADSFEVRAHREPMHAAHWFNLGAALYRIGDNVGARAAWVRAARLAPREPAVDRAFRLVPATDALSDALLPIEPITPTEGWLLAFVLWSTGWLLIAAKRRWRLVWVPFVLALLAGAWSIRTFHRYAQPVALVRRANTPLRSAPYGSAASRRVLNDGIAVQVARRDGAWLLVRRGNEAGWLLLSEVARI